MLNSNLPINQINQSIKLINQSIQSMNQSMKQLIIQSINKNIFLFQYVTSWNCSDEYNITYSLGDGESVTS